MSWDSEGEQHISLLLVTEELFDLDLSWKKFTECGLLNRIMLWDNLFKKFLEN